MSHVSRGGGAGGDDGGGGDGDGLGGGLSGDGGGEGEGGGGGDYQLCNVNLTPNQPIEWHYPLFPIPVAIDSRIGEQKTRMYIYATVIWNKVY